MIFIVVCIGFVLVQVFISNPAAQKILPTKASDGFGRRTGYAVVHRLVLVALVAIAGVIVYAFNL